MNVLIMSIVPSPYQRDLFKALSVRPEVSIRVRYAEAASPDSPWPKAELAPYEAVYRSFFISWGGKRFIINPQIPDLNWADVVVINGYVTIPAQIILRFHHKRRPVIFWAEQMVGSQGGIRGKVHRFLTEPLKKVDAVMAIGRKAYEDYLVRWPGKPVYELPYFCDLTAFGQSVPKRPRHPPTILFCGQMIERKGVDLLLAAAEYLVEEGYDFKLVLVGREAELPAMMASVSVKTRAVIEYAGFQAPDALPGFFRRSDIFVLPSRYDGWGVVVNQALGAGLPVVCSDAVGSAETLVSEGVNGTIFPSGDVAGLTAALRSFLDEPEAIRRFGEQSLKRAAEISPESGAAEWVRILEETRKEHNAHFAD